MGPLGRARGDQAMGADLGVIMRWVLSADVTKQFTLLGCDSHRPYVSTIEQNWEDLDIVQSLCFFKI